MSGVFSQEFEEQLNEMKVCGPRLVPDWFMRELRVACMCGVDHNWDEETSQLVKQVIDLNVPVMQKPELLH